MQKYDSKKIAERIRLKAGEQGKSMRMLMEEARLGINTVQKIGKGKDIHTLNFAKIADALDCSVDYLLGRTDNPEINDKKK